MIRRVLQYVRHNAIACLALFVALGGTGAYAANTIKTGDIVDDQVTSADVRDDNLGFGGLAAQDLGPNSVGASEIASQAVGADEVLNNSLLSSDLRTDSVGYDEVQDNSLRGTEILDNSLTGNDINESTLNMPPTTTVTAVGQGGVGVGDAFTKITGKTVPGGTYAVVATGNIDTPTPFGGHEIVSDAVCVLRAQSNQIGIGRDRRDTGANQFSVISISMNGIAQIPAGGGEISLWCRYQGGAPAGDGQIMAIRTDGAF